MRLSQRLIAATVLIALSGVLAGCSASGWDPTDLLDFLDTKKKLPGKREPVFPEGVPGLEQGVPKDLYKGAAEQQEQVDQQAAAAPPAAAEDPNGKKPAGAAGAPQEGAAAPSEPAKPKKKVVHQKPKAPAPVQQASQPAQAAAAPAQQSAAPFPAPMPSGSFAH
jgi:cell division septation protein DedD